MFGEILRRKFLIAAVLSVNILILSVGVMETWTSPVLPKLNNENRTDDNPLGRILTPEEESWIGALMSVGAALGPFPAAYAADKFGRKTALLGLSIPMLISSAILIFSKNVMSYCIARSLSGITVGGTFAVLPMYVAEISEPCIRGILSTTSNIFEVSGFLISYVIGPFISITLFNIVCTIIPCSFILTFVLMPESPFYLLAQNRNKEAEECLKKLRHTSDGKIEKELEDIRMCVKKDIENSLQDIIKTKSTLKALVITLSMISFQQLSGINVILYYTETIFDATGSTIRSDISSIIVGSVQLIASCITPFFVDKLGRRILFLVSAAGMLVSEVPLGLYFYLKDNGSNVESLYWLPVSCLVFYIVAYNFGFGPLPWTLMSEIFPENIKPLAASMTSCVCWTLSFILTKFFHSVSLKIGMGGSFWIFSGFTIVGLVFTFIYVPETKGKSFQEIQHEMYS